MTRLVIRIALLSAAFTVAAVYEGYASQQPGDWTAVDDGDCKVWDAEPESRESRVITWSGDCKDGTASGFGELRVVWEDGASVEVYVGEMQNGREHGVGILTIEGKTAYLGHWQDGRFHGAGTRFYDNSLLTGDFLEGEFEGPGTIVFRTGDPRHGDTVSANFEQSEPVGEVIYRYGDGRVFVGTLGHDWTPDAGRHIDGK